MSPLLVGVLMRIDKMKEGALYLIKPKVHIDSDGYASAKQPYHVMRGWREPTTQRTYPPFVYLGWKTEDWIYSYQHTNKIHYVMWQGDIYVMDNQFAKHIIHSWDGEEDGQRRN